MKYLVLILSIFILASCQQKPTQEEMDSYIDDYLHRKGVEFLDQTIDKYLAVKREEGRKIEEPEILKALNEPIPNFKREGMPGLGIAEAPVEIVIFGDLEDPFSGRAQATLRSLLDQYEGKMSISFRHHPLDKFKHSEKAAWAAAAAHRQGKFWPMIDRIYENSHRLSEAQYEKWAQELELDLEKFKKDMASEEIRQEVANDRQYARSQGMMSTPAVIVNGGVFYGAREIDRFQRIIDTALKEKPKN